MAFRNRFISNHIDCAKIRRTARYEPCVQENFLSLDSFLFGLYHQNLGELAFCQISYRMILEKCCVWGEMKTAEINYINLRVTCNEKHWLKKNSVIGGEMEPRTCIIIYCFWLKFRPFSSPSPSRSGRFFTCQLSRHKGREAPESHQSRTNRLPLSMGACSRT